MQMFETVVPYNKNNNVLIFDFLDCYTVILEHDRRSDLLWVGTARNGDIHTWPVVLP